MNFWPVDVQFFIVFPQILKIYIPEVEQKHEMFQPDLVTEYLRMILEYRDDELDGLHRHLNLLVQGHRHNPVLELRREQLKLILNLKNETDYILQNV